MFNEDGDLFITDRIKVDLLCHVRRKETYYGLCLCFRRN